MKLQISFDLDDLQKAVDIAIKVSDYVDIIEIGSLLIYKYGINAVEKFRKDLPQKTILVDSKIIEKGKDIANILLEAGADWITVMAGISKDIIHATCTTAHNLNKKSMLDITDSSSPGQSALEAKSFGADAILFHQPFDNSQAIFMDKWDMVRGNTNLSIFISANINRGNVAKIIEFNPDGIIVGQSIVKADNPQEEAKFFYDLCKS